MRALNGVFGRCRCNRIGDTDVRIELTEGQLNVGQLERAFEFAYRDRVRVAAVRANKRQNAVTVRKPGHLGGLYARPKCEARNGTAVRDDRVLAIPGQILIGVEDLVKSASRAIIQFAGTEGNDCVGLASGKGFREGRCKKVLVRWIFMMFSPFNAFIMTEQGEKI